MEGIKQFGIMRYVQDNTGEIYLNMNDIIKEIDLKKPMMTKVFVEHLTMEKFCSLLRNYEDAIKKLP